jgi:hypothetical protein
VALRCRTAVKQARRVWTSGGARSNLEPTVTAFSGLSMMMMLRRSGLAAALVLPVVLSALAPARADETGLASIHTWKKVGKKTCMLDHTHTGQASGANRKAAEAAAIQNWASFTDLEYGSDWASFKLSERRTMTCSRDGAQSFTCLTESLPCRPY